MRILYALISLAPLVLCWPDPSLAQDFPCPAPSEQKDSNIKGDVEGKAQTFLKVAGADLKGNVEKTVVDLFSKYPNSDRVAIINTILSTTCQMIRNSSQLTDVEKFDKWMAVLSIVHSFLPDDKRSEYAPPVLNLGALELGIQKGFADGMLGSPKFVRDVEIRGEQDERTKVFAWEKKKEYYYRYMGTDIRIIFDDTLQAISIFVGLWGDANIVYVAAPGDWPIEFQGDQPISWATLKFQDVGNEHCDQWVNSAASASVVSIKCGYTYRPPGGSQYNSQSCFFSAGYSDGAYDVRTIRNGPELSSSDIDKLIAKGESDEKIREFTWDAIKEKGINYFMLTCDERLIKDDWN